MNSILDSQKLVIEIDLANLPLYDLMRAVTAHPECIWATVFSWPDVEEQLFALHAEGDVEGLTLDTLKTYRRTFEKAIEAACMGGGEWDYAIRSVIYNIATGRETPDA